MATNPERNPLEVMLENLTPEQKDIVDKIAKEKNIPPVEALLEKINQEREENSANKEYGHAP